MVKKQLSAEPRKKVEAVDLDLVAEDRMVVDLMEKEGHTEIGSHTVRENRLEIDRLIVTESQQVRENHDEINQPLETENQQVQADHLETDQDRLVLAELVQQDQVDQAPLLVDQDQIDKIYFYKQKQTIIREMINPHVIVCFH